MIGRSGLLTLIVLALSASPALGQDWSGQVKRPGEVGLTIEGTNTSFQSLYVGGKKQPLGEGLGGPVDPATFAPLANLMAATETFLSAIDSTSTGVLDQDFLAGDLDARLSWNTRVGSARLGLGVLPRVEIGAGASIYRTEMLPLMLGLTGGTLGLNPDRNGNATLLAGLDDSGQAVGGAAVLPLEGSSLGSQLQDLVFAAAGDSLALPETPLSIAEFSTAFGFIPFAHQVSPIRMGDLEIDARIEILRTFDGAYYPIDEGGLNVRLTAMGAMRFPTGDRGIETPIPDWGPEIGHGGFSGGGILDVFAGQFFWGSVGATYSRLSAATVLVPASPAAISGLQPGSIEARVTPGVGINFGAVSRIRLTNEISVGGSFQLDRTDAGTLESEGVTSSIESRSLRSLGMEIGYTSLPAYEANRTIAPIDAAVGFRTAINGSGGAPAATVAFARVTILYRLWGSSD